MHKGGPLQVGVGTGLRACAGDAQSQRRSGGAGEFGAGQVQRYDGAGGGGNVWKIRRQLL